MMSIIVNTVTYRYAITYGEGELKLLTKFECFLCVIFKWSTLIWMYKSISNKTVWETEKLNYNFSRPSCSWVINQINIMLNVFINNWRNNSIFELHRQFASEENCKQFNVTQNTSPIMAWEQYPFNSDLIGSVSILLQVLPTIIRSTTRRMLQNEKKSANYIK